MDEITNILNQILEMRHQKAQVVLRRGEELKQEQQSLQVLYNSIDSLKDLKPEVLNALCGDQITESLFSNLERLHSCITKDYEQAYQANQSIYERFNRKTINLSVVGMTGVGKSKLLQSISGLGDDCIPSFVGGSCTGVTSIIENYKDQTRAIFVFKTREQVIQTLNQEIKNLAVRIEALRPAALRANVYPHVDSLNQDAIKRAFTLLDTTAGDIARTGNNKTQTDARMLQGEAHTLLIAYTQHLSDWEFLLAQPNYSEEPSVDTPHPHDPDLKFLGTDEDGHFLYKLDNLARIKEYISKHDGNSTRFYRYIAVEKAVIQTNLEGLEGKIRLVDTVGINDPAADTTDRLEDALRNESDGVIFMKKAEVRHNDSGSIDPEDRNFFNQIREMLVEHWDKKPGLWMSFLMNNMVPNIGKVQADTEKYLNQILDFYKQLPDGLFGSNGIQFCKVVNVGDSAAVRKYVYSFLEHIARNLGQIDAIIEANAMQLVENARWERKQLMEIFKDWPNEISLSLGNSNYLTNLKNNRINSLKESLSAYAEELEQQRKNENTVSFLQQRLKMVKDLADGGKVEIHGKPVSLENIIARAQKDYPAKPDSARLSAIHQLPEVIRQIAVLPAEDQVELERKYKTRMAEIFVDKIQIALDRLNPSDAFKVDDPHFFQKMGNLALRNSLLDEQIRIAFDFLEQFRLNEMNGLTKVLFIHHASIHLAENPNNHQAETKNEILSHISGLGQNLPKSSSGIHADKNGLMNELKEMLHRFVEGVQTSVGQETYLVSYYDQMWEELIHFMQVLTPEFGNSWFLVFESLQERKLLSEDKQVQTSRELLNKIVFQLNAYFANAGYGDRTNIQA